MQNLFKIKAKSCWTLANMLKYFMKKNFSLTSTKHKPARQIELIKAEINKYVARERRKKLPEDAGFWDFDCKCGRDEAAATSVHVSLIGKELDKIFESQAETIYIEILAKPGARIKKISHPQQNDT